MDLWVDGKSFFIVVPNVVKIMQQLIRYGVVGVVSNLTIYCVYLLITYHGVEPKIAMTLLFITGASVGFIGNRQWTFAQQGNLSKSTLRYVIAYAIAYMLNFFSMWIAVDRMGVPHYWVQAVNLVVISALLFIVQKYWIFTLNHPKCNGLDIVNSTVKRRQ